MANPAHCIEKYYENTIVMGKILPENYFELEKLCKEMGLELEVSYKEYWVPEKECVESLEVFYILGSPGSYAEKMEQYCKFQKIFHEELGERINRFYDINKKDELRKFREAPEVIWVENEDEKVKVVPSLLDFDHSKVVGTDGDVIEEACENVRKYDLKKPGMKK